MHPVFTTSSYVAHGEVILLHCYILLFISIYNYLIRRVWYSWHRLCYVESIDILQQTDFIRQSFFPQIKQHFAHRNLLNVRQVRHSMHDSELWKATGEIVDIPAEIRVISDALDTKMADKAITKRSVVVMLHDQKMYIQLAERYQFLWWPHFISFHKFFQIWVA
jgi:hypothetical protein